MLTSTFEIKQGHLTSIRFVQRETGPLGLTPARLDMLRAILNCGDRCLQSELRLHLCVSKTVISVMVRSLEELEFVERRRAPEDRRTFVLRLTPQAIHALRRAHHQAKAVGFADLALSGAFQVPRLATTPWRPALAEVEARIQLFRRAFGVGLANPWVVHDDDERFYYAEVPDNPNREDIIPTWEEDLAAERPLVRDYSADPTAPHGWEERSARSIRTERSAGRARFRRRGPTGRPSGPPSRGTERRPRAPKR